MMKVEDVLKLILEGNEADGEVEIVGEGEKCPGCGQVHEQPDDSEYGLPEPLAAEVREHPAYVAMLAMHAHGLTLAARKAKLDAEATQHLAMLQAQAKRVFKAIEALHPGAKGRLFQFNLEAHEVRIGPEVVLQPGESIDVQPARIGVSTRTLQ
jgi:hypothetical protein